MAELRDPHEKVTEFAGMNLSTGSPLWRNDQLEEKWWTTLNKIYKDVLFLHQFVRPDMPTPEKIFALDLFTGKLLWQNNELSYLSVSNDTVFGMRKTFQSEDIVGLDYKSGEEKQVFSTSDYQTQGASTPEEEFILPEPLDAGASLELLPTGAKTPMTMKFSNNEIVGYHVGAGTDAKGVPLYDAHVMIVDSTGKIVFEDVADRKVYAPLQDFFFVVPLRGKRLIYVRNTDEIVTVKLS